MRQFDDIKPRQRIGKLTALEYIPGTPGKWKCQCDCGNITFVRAHNLKRGITKSCGCLKYKNQKQKYKTLIKDAKTDLTGMKFGKLTVLKPLDKCTDQGKIWLCLCDCGNTCEVTGVRLRHNQAKSCGCSRGKDLTGERFGKLTVLEKTNKRYYGYVVWKCKCDCGNVVEVPSHNLSYNKGTISCGCALQEIKDSWGDRAKKTNKYRFAKFGVGYTQKGEKFFFDTEDYDKLQNYCWRYDSYHRLVAYIRGAGKTGHNTIAAWKIILNENNEYKHVKFKNGNYWDLRKKNLEVN